MGYAWINRQPLGSQADGLPLGSQADGLPLGQLADGLVPLLMLVSLAAWIGCWLDGCAYGPESLAWWSLPARDEWGLLSWRFPTQLLAALLTLALFWLVDRWRPGRKIPGLTASLAVIGLMAIILAASFLRADPGLVWNGLRLDAWAALGFGLLAGLLAGILAWL